MSFFNTLDRFLNLPIQTLKTQWWSSTCQNPNTKCPILQLPLDVILLISDQLPDHAKVLLSQTCRSLKSILGHQTLSHLSTVERIQFLVHLSRNSPNIWVCAACQKQHPATENDLQGEWWRSSCPGITAELDYMQPGTLFAVNHSRVQLTLKHLRLGGGHDGIFHQSLETLLKPDRWTRIINDNNHCLFCFSLSVPKVVDGRYLVHYTWEYKLDNVPPSVRVMPYLMVCPHQRVSRPNLTTVWGEERKQLIRVLGEVLRSDESEDLESCGSCSMCLTDFAVRISSRRVLIEAWKDLGTEDAPCNPAWMSHLRDNASDWRSRSHFGSIRKLYYS